MYLGRNQKAVLEALKDGPKPVTDIARLTGINRPLVSQAGTKLKADGLVELVTEKGKELRGVWQLVDGVDVDTILANATIAKGGGGGGYKRTTLVDRFDKLLIELNLLFDELRPLVVTAKEREEYEKMKKVGEMLRTMK